MHPLDDDADPRVRLAREATRVADRLRSLSLDRLDRPGERGAQPGRPRPRGVAAAGRPGRGRRGTPPPAGAVAAAARGRRPAWPSRRTTC
nr:hypothetical protein [Angustibacter aerolatus]